MQWHPPALRNNPSHCSRAHFFISCAVCRRMKMPYIVLMDLNARCDTEHLDELVGPPLVRCLSDVNNWKGRLTSVLVQSVHLCTVTGLTRVDYTGLCAWANPIGFQVAIVSTAAIHVSVEMGRSRGSI